MPETLDLTKYFFGGLAKGEETTKKRRADEAARLLMESVTRAMAPRETTVYPDLSASPGVLPGGKMPELGIPGSQTFFQTPAAPQTVTQQPGRAEIQRGILEAVASSPEAIQAAEIAGKLFGGFMGPDERKPTLAEPGQAAYIPDKGWEQVPGTRLPKAGDVQLIQDEAGKWWAVNKTDNTRRDIGLQGRLPADAVKVGYDENGQMVLVNAVSGTTHPIPGVFGTQSHAQRQQSTDQYTAQLLQKYNAGQATDFEIQTLDMLIDMKQRGGIMAVMGPQITGVPPKPKPWEQAPEKPPAAGPAPEKPSLWNWWKGGEGVVTAPKPTTPAPSAKPRYRKPQDQAPGPGQPQATNPGTGAKPAAPKKTTSEAPPAPAGDGSFTWRVGGKTWSFAPPQGMGQKDIQDNIDGFYQAWQKGVALNELFEIFHANGWTVTPGGM